MVLEFRFVFFILFLERGDVVVEGLRRGCLRTFVFFLGYDCIVVEFLYRYMYYFLGRREGVFWVFIFGEEMFGFL